LSQPAIPTTGAANARELYQWVAQAISTTGAYRAGTPTAEPFDDQGAPGGPRHDFASAVRRLAAGEDPRSSLALAVGPRATTPTPNSMGVYTPR
jgi:hypothetical protein